MVCSTLSYVVVLCSSTCLEALRLMLPTLFSKAMAFAADLGLLLRLQGDEATRLQEYIGGF